MEIYTLWRLTFTALLYSPLFKGVTNNVVWSMVFGNERASFYGN